ncbi:MAG TPA: cyclodeaminase/cyclohydrolase family protein [Acidimicrobiales bacterium]|jgi:formiminotetrahydrofolate cyclodeaminase
MEEWLETLAARTPTPGGGAVAAMAAASAAALIGMVSIYTTGEKWTDREPRMLELNALAAQWRIQALVLADEDEVAFAAVGAAYALPKTTDGEIETRQKAIQAALKGAAEPPVRTAQLAALIVESAAELVGTANPNVLSDVGVASAMAEAALSSASLNIAINASQISDHSEKGRLSAALEVAAYDGLRARLVTAQVMAAMKP